MQERMRQFYCAVNDTLYKVVEVNGAVHTFILQRNGITQQVGSGSSAITLATSNSEGTQRKTEKGQLNIQLIL